MSSVRKPLTAEPVSSTAMKDDVDLLTPLLNGRSLTSESGKPTGPVIGLLIGIKADATPLVLLPGNVVAHAARSVVDLKRNHIACQVVVIFEDNDWQQPIVMGVIRDQPRRLASDASGRIDVDLDGERMIVSARRELVLRCGAASITLDHHGRITVRGTQIVSHASGVNRIRGGSVELN